MVDSSVRMLLLHRPERKGTSAASRSMNLRAANNAVQKLSIRE